MVRILPAKRIEDHQCLNRLSKPHFIGNEVANTGICQHPFHSCNLMWVRFRCDTQRPSYRQISGLYASSLRLCPASERQIGIDIKGGTHVLLSIFRAAR